MIEALGLRRNPKERRAFRVAWQAALLTVFLLACDSLTDPGSGPQIQISFNSDTTVIVGTVVVPEISVSVDGEPARRRRITISSSDPSVVAVSAGSDTLFINKRGVATLTITLVGSTLGDQPPQTETTLRAIADDVVILEPSILFQVLNDTLTLNARALSATDDTLPGQAAWTSSDTGVVTVDVQGTLTAIENGTAIVRAVIDDDTAQVDVEVRQRLAGFELDPSPLVLNSLGKVTTLTATPVDSGGSEIPSAAAPSPSWETANPSVASVSSSGAVTAESNGDTFVRALAEDVVDSVRVQVSQVAARVQIFGDRNVFIDALGETSQLIAVAFDSLEVDLRNKTPIWISRDLEVAQVGTNTGIVRAISEGSAVIVAEVDTAADSITVTIEDVPQTLEITPDTLDFASINDTTQVIGTVRNKFGEELPDIPITWRTIDSAIAKALTDGRVIATSVGTTRLIGTLDNGVVDTSVVNVSNLPETVEIIPVDVTLASILDTLIPEVDIRNARGDPLERSSVTWTVLDPAVVTVSASGVIVARGKGSTVVRATNPLNAAQQDELGVEVTNAPETITLNRDSDILSAPTKTLDYNAVLRNSRGALIPEGQEQVTWSTSSASVATIDGEGLATAVGEGIALIIADVGSGDGLRADTATLEVQNEVVSLTLSPVDPTISSVGDSLQMNATARNDVGDQVAGLQFIWESSDSLVASVSTAGLVSGLSVGQATISVSLGDSLVTNTTVTVTNFPAQVSIIPDDTTLESVGDTAIPEVIFLNARGEPLLRSDADWDSDAADVAFVTNEGVIIALKKGTTTIRARNPVSTSIEDAMTVVITNAPDSITVSPDTVTLPSISRTQQFSAVVRNARGNIITGFDSVVWVSLDPSIVSIDENGLATARNIGVDTIIGIAGSVQDISVVKVQNSAVQVLIDPSSITLGSLLDTVRLSVTALNELGNEIPRADTLVVWASTNPSVATVDPNTGLVTAISVGSASITATVNDVTAAAPVSVSNFPSVVEIIPDLDTLDFLGETVTPAVDFRNGADSTLDRDAVIWSTSNQNVAQVSGSGVITAAGKGSATICATSAGNNTNQDCMEIVVTNAPVSMTLNADSVDLTSFQETFQFVAEVFNSNGDLVSNATVTWTKTNNGAISLNTTGRATAVALGVDTVTATSDTVSAQAVVVVTNSAVSLDVTPDTTSILDLDSTTQLAVLAPNNRGDPVPSSSISWESLDPGIASVTQTGQVTALQEGIARIRAVQDTVSDISQVRVVNVPRTIEVGSAGPDTISLASAGDSIDLVPLSQILNAGGDSLGPDRVTWTSRSTGIASVSAGLVRSSAKGSAWIVAANNSGGAIDSVLILVTNAPASIDITQDVVSILALDRQAQLTAKVFNEAGAELTGEPVRWRSAGASATVDSTTGLVTAVAVDTVEVIARAANDTTLADTVEVRITNNANTLSFTPVDSAVIRSLQDTAVLRVEAFNLDGAIIVDPTVNWSIPVGDAVTIADQAADSVRVVGVNIGTATVRATVDGKSADATVRVANEVATVILGDPLRADLNRPDTLLLPGLGVSQDVEAVLLNELGDTIQQRNKVDWSSLQGSIVTVDAVGSVTGQQEGTGTVLAESRETTAADSIVVVVQNAPDSIEISDKSDTLLITNGQTLEFTADVFNQAGQLIQNAVVEWSLADAADSAIASIADSVLTATTVSTIPDAVQVIAQSGSVADTVRVRLEKPTKVFVDNSVVSSRKHGTERHPFTKVDTAITFAVDISVDSIVVKPGTGSYSNTNVSLPFGLNLLGDTAGAQCGTTTCAAPENLPLLRTLSGSVLTLSGAGLPRTVRYLAFSTGASAPAIDVSNDAEVDIQFVWINPTATVATGRGISLVGSGPVTVRNSGVRFTNMFGIRVEGPVSTQIALDNVTIDTVANGWALEIDSATNATVDSLAIANGATGLGGIDVRKGSGVTVSNSSIQGGQIGLRLDSTDGAVDTLITITGADSIGIEIRGSTNSLIKKTSVDAIGGSSQAYGALVSDGSSNVIRSSSVSGVQGWGVWLDSTTTARLDSVRVSTIDSSGIVAIGPNPVTLDSIAVDTVGSPLRPGSGVLLWGGSDHQITRGLISNVEGWGIRLDSTETTTVDSVSVVSADSAGIRLLADSGSTIDSASIDLSASGSGQGIVMVNSVDPTVRFGTLLGGTRGIVLDTVRGAVVDTMVVSGSTTAAVVVVRGDSIDLRSDSVNLINGTALLVRESEHLTVADNRFVGQDTLVVLDSALAVQLDTNLYALSSAPLGTPAIDVTRGSDSITVRGDSLDLSSNADGFRLRDSSTVTLDSVAVEGGRYAISLDSTSVTSSRVRLNGAQTAFRIGREATLASTNDTILSATAQCILANDVNSTITFTSLGMTSCGASAPEAIQVNGSGSKLTLLNSAVSGITGRIINFVTGDSLVLINDTLIADATGGPPGLFNSIDVSTVAQDSAAVWVAAGNAAIKTSTIGRFGDRIGLSLGTPVNADIDSLELTRNLIGLKLPSAGTGTIAVDSSSFYDNRVAIAAPDTTGILNDNWWGDSLGPRRYNGTAAAPVDSAVGDSVAFANLDSIPRNTTVGAATPIGVGSGTADTLIVIRGPELTVPEDSTHRVVVAVRVVDASGKPATADSVIFTADKQEFSSPDAACTVGSQDIECRRGLDAGGVARISITALSPGSGLGSGESDLRFVTATLKSNNKEAIISITVVDSDSSPEFPSP